MKTITKKLWSLITALFVTANAYAYDFEADGLYFDLTSLSNRTCKLTGGNTSYSGCLIIPESVDYEGLKFKVTEVDAKAFNSNITELSIPQTVGVIPYGTISNCKLTKLIICDGENDLKIDDYTKKGSDSYGPTFAQPLQALYIGRNVNCNFYCSDKLIQLEFGPYVNKMPYMAKSTKLETVVIPDNITEIESGSLYGCTNLKTVYVGNGIKKIPREFCHSCKNLETVFLGSSISEIGSICFSNCTKLVNLYIFSDQLVTISDGTTYNIESALPKTIAKIFVADPSRYDNLLNGYYRESLITIDNTSFEFSGKIPQFSYRNYVQGSTITFDPNNVNINSGTYNTKVDVIFTFSNGWSSKAAVPISYTITPAQLTIIPENVSRQFRLPNPELSCSFFGFKNNETAAVLTKQPIVETTATINSPAGTYPIIVAGAEAQNYTFNYERGTLTVTKANQEIEWDQSFGSVKVGDVIELNATCTSGLPIKYSVTDESIAEVFSQSGKKCVEFLKSGSVSIRANQEGNENYNEADRVSKRIVVGEPEEEVNILEFEGIIGNVGEKIAIGAKVVPDDVTDPTINWRSSDPEVAAVDGEGTVWFNAAGSAVVTAECQGHEFSVPFIVEEVVAQALNVFPVEAVGGVGHQFNLLALHEPENTTDKSVTWESSDPNVATVSEDGRVELASIGSAQITARSGEHTAVCDVTVSNTVNLTEMASSGVVIDIIDGGIVVRNVAEGESIAVYSVDGKVINGAVVEGPETQLKLAAGIYIVKVSPDTIAKVFIK